MTDFTPDTEECAAEETVDYLEIHIDMHRSFVEQWADYLEAEPTDTNELVIIATITGMLETIRDSPLGIYVAPDMISQSFEEAMDQQKDEMSEMLWECVDELID